MKRQILLFLVLYISVSFCALAQPSHLLVGGFEEKIPAQVKNPVVPKFTKYGYTHGKFPSWDNRTHAGIDIWADAGSDVFAFADGEVTDINDDKKDANFATLGFMVIIKHPPLSNSKVFHTIYLHLQSKPEVEVGDKVQGGKSKIGEIGTTGAANGVPHTHFEIRYFQTRFLQDKKWNNPYNIYGIGNKRDSEVFKNNWEDPLEFFKKYPSGISFPTTQPPPKPIQPPVKVSLIPTLFLFDVSGSMAENNKIEQARTAGLDALKEIRANSPNNSSTVSILTFAGDCKPTSTKRLLDFTPNLAQAENSMQRLLPKPDGGTPLPQAKDTALGEMLSYLNANPNIKEGRIILMSDGQSTCGEIRPPDIYSRRYDIKIQRPNSAVKFFTIGFDVPAGSAAERDLQYLASETGGKYFNAADRRQLIRAFQKHIRRFIPRVGKFASNADFINGLQAFEQSDYALAVKYFRAFTTANNTDPAGWYNLALALEAVDRYKAAAQMYRRYLQTFPNAADRAEIERRIGQLEQDYIDQFIYYIAVVESDLEYLKRYWQSIYNRKSADLGQEFAGFIYEKRDFYAGLPEILETEARWLVNDSRDLADSVDTLAERVKLPTFDRDALSLLTIPIAQLEDLSQKLRNYATKNLP